MYFYKIGDYVLASDQAAVSREMSGGVNSPQEYQMLKFNDSATVSVIEPGDEYEPDND